MRQNKAEKLLPIIQGIAEGKQLQFSFNGVTWIDERDELELKTICDDIIADSCDYRIKSEENHTIEQNAGETESKGGTVNVSSLTDTFKCWKCGRTLPISERTDFVYTSNPPKYSCKECEGIKKEKQYRPFKDCDELIEYWYDFTGVINCSPKLFMPGIWVKSKEYGVELKITGFDNKAGSVPCVFVEDMWKDMNDLFNDFTFLDGSPCGLEENK